MIGQRLGPAQRETRARLQGWRRLKFRVIVNEDGTRERWKSRDWRTGKTALRPRRTAPAASRRKSRARRGTQAVAMRARTKRGRATDD
jgi:hypothetical protein